MSTVILLHKPFHVMCQFTDTQGRSTLADFVDSPGMYPAGRLDFDSEGLVLLTDDGQLQQRIASPRQKMSKTYWVQVEGEITDDAVHQLAEGVGLKDGPTLPANARRMEHPDVWERHPAVRHRPTVPTSWLSLTLREGRNRQVRRMTAAVGFPTLRLIRQQIGDWSLDGIGPGLSRSQTIHLPRQQRIRNTRKRHNSRGKPNR